MRSDMAYRLSKTPIHAGFCAWLRKYGRATTVLACLQLISVLSTSLSFAQANAPASAPANATNHVRRTRPTVDDRVKVLAKSLDLNESQQTAVKKILERRQQETLRIRTDPTISGSARMEQFRMLQDRTAEQIRAVLNEEQRKKYDPFAARRIPQSEGRTVEDWLKVTTPK
jgi:Spy/CpxP family protein refolding chaperone